MTIDEAKNKIYKYISFSQENIDLLVALKALIQDYENGYKEAYNKSIDDFANWLVKHNIVDKDSMPEIIMDFNEEQLKAGGENEEIH